MASRAGSSNQLPLTDCSSTEAWLRGFAAKCRSKKLTDGEAGYQITDLFLAKAGVEALQEVSIMAAPKVLENMRFEEIRKVIMDKMSPKKRLIIAERTRFLATMQDPAEDIRHYTQRLREAAKFCEFDKLNSADARQTAEDELIQMRLVDGIHNSSHRVKLLEYMQAADTTPSLDNCVQFAQQLELIQRFKGDDRDTKESAMSMEVAHVDRNKQSNAPCRFCGRTHSHGRCPAYGKTCSKCSRKNHFAAVCRSNKAAHEVMAEAAVGTKDEKELTVYNVVDARTKCVRSVIIDGKRLPLQLDSGSEASIIPKNWWERLAIGCCADKINPVQQWKRTARQAMRI